MTVPEYDDVYAALWPRLVRTAYAVSGDLGQAEDAVQTAFGKAYRCWRRISRLGAPEAYLRRMVLNEVFNDRRRARRRQANAGPCFAVCGLAYDDATGRVFELGRSNGMPAYGSSAAWAGDRLMLLGGAAQAPSGTSGPAGFSNRPWVWTS